ncbi:MULTISPECIES: M20 aminoacylase family protein [unclassified Mesorhizobium]|jgi:amidohydrolase|uniref:M20 aminoacylase family protein n=1 Tax=unclassified Mesorhizobium TaxID=325217 RepID=UPI000FCCAC02|nr:MULTISPECIES: M20 aminoacylase family protein [unclassified Mesorhizobium]RUV47493.1 amidohydrolase [Mesorhizobium sp. M7A.F.Ca.MR.228.00.0.0]AZV19868.1 amidohydrolase [Mesorhizobium sp. M7A.F.Ce.TU.012.03.2.1]RUU92052.1 amidohydrolase [Mesorhizobium sp. M7A.F.Ca.MR.176.00.0.0]RUV18434.1 amidohydrolase [Mesorhizobium sp. M7A.F.Ca.MR.245.00.0.0]RVD14626.1 amidohydrolase [Mesorhizobium sp. M7A.F.Ca.ET.027.02.1.1]
MPILNRAAEMQDEVAGWRQHLHQTPELNFDVFKTAAFVTEKLKAFGCDDVVTGLGKTGVVGIIRGRQGEGPTIGLRADMDALPLNEITGKSYASTIPGKMHACGHDGHTAMLLGAAKYLAETRNFTGSVAVIFQPAEEGGGGGNEMVKDGMMERFDISRVFGMHNMPGLPVGQFAIRPGPIMAATAEFTITVRGKGGHAAMPHGTIDPIVITSQLVGALQTIASRSTDPVEAVVVSVTKFHAGDAYNIIPETAEIAGTVRTLRKEIAKKSEERIRSICDGLATAFGAKIEVDYQANYPVTFNHAEETVFAGDVAMSVAGDAHVHRGIQPVMGGEDFSYMLEARPGAFIFIGNGDTAGLHNPAYDFNDEVIPHGMSYWVKLAETALAA